MYEIPYLTMLPLHLLQSVFKKAYLIPNIQNLSVFSKMSFPFSIFVRRM